MTMFAYCRRAHARHPGIKGLWFLAIFGLLFAGLPRWEVHQHAKIDDHHAFELHSHEHHGDSLDAVTAEVDEGVTFTHCHAAPSVAVAIFPTLPSLEPAPPKSAQFPEPATIHAASAGPPPQRPPIV